MTERDNRVYNRRTYLKTVATGVGATFVAGCQDSSGGGGSDGDSGGDGSSSDGSDGNSGDGSDGTSTDGSGSSDKEYTIGYSNFTNAIPFEILVRKATAWYGEDSDRFTVETAAGDGTPEQQLQDSRNLLRQGVDGLIVTPADSNAMATIAEEADVPVFSADIPINSEQIGMHVGVNQLDYSGVVAEELLSTMDDQFGADHQHRVLEILMDQDNSNAVLRHRGFQETIGEADNAEIVREIEIDGFAAESVADKATTYLRQDDDIHGVIAPWAGGLIGTLRAFERYDMRVPNSEDGHVPMAGNGTSAAVLDLINDGLVDVGVGQPNQFYGPLALEYMADYLDSGQDPSVLPEIGTEVTSDDISISGSNHAGLDVWSEQVWAPANVREFVSFNDENLGFPFLTTANIVVTAENTGEPYVWGNIARNM